jgi:flagellar capping protein FliD
MGITINGPSGIDTASLIDQLVALEQDKVTTVENKVTAYQTQISDYSTLKSYISDIATKAKALGTTSDFDLFTASSTDDASVTVSGGEGATEDSYDVTVYHLAKSEKMISKDAQISSQTATLKSLGITTGVISINGTEITIDDDDTIQDLRSKINSATDSDGESIGVTASVIKTSSSNYRLVLSSEETGSAGITYKDVSGSTLQDLGIITDADGEKGTTTQTLTSTDDFKTMFNNLATGASITYSGLDHEGNTVSNTFVKTSGLTIDDFLSQVKTTYHNMVDATIDDTTGKLTITDKATGTSRLSLNSLNAGGTAETVSIIQNGTNGAGVLQAGSDAYFNLDGLYMSNTSNNPDDVVTGVTFHFLKASADDTTTVSLSYDTNALEEKVQDLLDSYNTLLNWVTDETKFADSSDSDSEDGDLAGDMTVKDILSKVRNALHGSFGLFGSSINSLTMLGVKTDATTGEMSLDSDKFASAITKNFDQFEKLFTTNGASSNANITYGRSTTTTKSGAYTLRELDSTHMQIKLAGDDTWYTSDARNGDIVTFSSGQAKGLSITAASGILSGGEATFTFQNGLAGTLQNLSDQITDSSSGTIQLHVDSLNSMVDAANDRITRMQTSVDDYRTRLQKQYAAMEEALQKMKSQYNQMASALGLDTSSTS